MRISLTLRIPSRRRASSGGAGVLGRKHAALRPTGHSMPMAGSSKRIERSCSGAVGRGHLVAHLGIVLERHEAMGEAFRHENLVPLFRRKDEPDPAAKGRRAAADVDRDIEDRARATRGPAWPGPPAESGNEGREARLCVAERRSLSWTKRMSMPASRSAPRYRLRRRSRARRRSGAESSSIRSGELQRPRLEQGS